MKTTWITRLVIPVMVLSVACVSVTIAQPRGGGGFRGGGGGGARPTGKAPSFGGAGSVVHRDFSPPTGMSRPTPRPMPAPSASGGARNKPTSPKLPNIPDYPRKLNPSDRSPVHNLHPSDIPGAHRKPDRPVQPDVGPDRSDFKPKRPNQASDKPPRPEGFSAPDRRPDHSDFGFRDPHHDGPDWKDWKQIDKSKIHDSIVNKSHVDPKTADKVRKHFDDHYSGNDFFSKDWFDKHPGGWHPGKPDHGPGHHPPGPGPHPPHHGPPPPHFWWHHPSWNHAWGWFAAGFFTEMAVHAVVQPVPYYYGSNIVYENNVVYINDVPYVGAEEYYRQALDLAEAGVAPNDEQTSTSADKTETAETGNQESPDDDWLSMGTFAVVNDGNEEKPKRIVQIATNKQGQVRGNLIDPESGEAVELYGRVDSKTQRVAFKLSGNDDCVAECGLWNLTQDTVPLLVHVDKDRTEERTLVRLVNDAADDSIQQAGSEKSENTERKTPGE